MRNLSRASRRNIVRHRISRKIRGNAERPRLAVRRTLKHVYVQAIDDEAGKTLATASTMEKDLRSSLPSGGNVEAAKKVGTRIAERLKAAGIESAVFDRGGHLFHGRVKALADAAREGGLKF